MLFNSLAFGLFLPVVFLLYWLLPCRVRWALLLAASYYFYMSWNVKYVVLIFATTVVSYVAGLLLEGQKEEKKRKRILFLVLAVCLGLLFFFKYFAFFWESIFGIFSLFAIPLPSITLKFMLPVGISFYTFQTLSYVMDVYKGRIKAERHFGIYAAFISFFPQLVAGPIERTENLLPQIRTPHSFDEEQAMYGAKMMLWGYYKKLVVADLLAGYVDKIFGFPEAYTGFAWVLAVFFFSLQIYCDFSGYSDIAIGTAKLFGINLMTNFKSPYFASSIREFWSRWHISLSTWFRDYVYIPLGGNRRGKKRKCCNLMATFLVSGLWHGANWTFVVWGAVHGLAQIVEDGVHRRRKTKVGRWVSILAVFIFCNLAWVFFRADTLSEGLWIIAQMPKGIANPVRYLQSGLIQMGIWTLQLLYLGVLIVMLAGYDYLNQEQDVIKMINRKPTAFQWAFYLGLGLFVLFFSQKGVGAEFVYFQF